jgi:single-strand DNA-binding protein
VSFDIANNTGWGEYKKVIFLTCNLWGKTGTGVFNYLKKGKLVAVSGELQIQKWTSNQDGLEKSKNVINCRECLLMPDGSSKQSSSQDSYAGNDTSGYEDDGGDIPY